MATLPEASCLNRFENCVMVKLHFDRPPKQCSTESSPDEIDIRMTIRFGQEQSMEIKVPLFGGKVYFGIQRGDLELILENCRLPLEKVSLDQEFQLSVEVESLEEGGIEFQAGKEPSLKSATKASEKTK